VGSKARGAGVFDGEHPGEIVPPRSADLPPDSHFQRQRRSSFSPSNGPALTWLAGTALVSRRKVPPIRKLLGFVTHAPAPDRSVLKPRYKAPW